MPLRPFTARVRACLLVLIVSAIALLTLAPSANATNFSVLLTGSQAGSDQDSALSVSNGPIGDPFIRTLTLTFGHGFLPRYNRVGGTCSPAQAVSSTGCPQSSRLGAVRSSAVAFGFLPVAVNGYLALSSERAEDLYGAEAMLVTKPAGIGWQLEVRPVRLELARADRPGITHFLAPEYRVDLGDLPNRYRTALGLEVPVATYALTLDGRDTTSGGKRWLRNPTSCSMVPVRVKLSFRGGTSETVEQSPPITGCDEAGLDPIEVQFNPKEVGIDKSTSWRVTPREIPPAIPHPNPDERDFRVRVGGAQLAIEAGADGTVPLCSATEMLADACPAASKVGEMCGVAGPRKQPVCGEIWARSYTPGDPATGDGEIGLWLAVKGKTKSSSSSGNGGSVGVTTGGGSTRLDADGQPVVDVEFTDIPQLDLRQVDWGFDTTMFVKARSCGQHDVRVTQRAWNDKVASAGDSFFVTCPPRVSFTDPNDSDSDGDGFADDRYRPADFSIDYDVVHDFELDPAATTCEATISGHPPRGGSVVLHSQTAATRLSCSFSGLDDGDHDIALTAVDASGNATTLVTRVTVDGTPPQIAVNEEGIEFTGGTSHELVVEITDAHLATVTCGLQLSAAGGADTNTGCGDRVNHSCGSDPNAQCGDTICSTDPDVSCGDSICSLEGDVARPDVHTLRCEVNDLDEGANRVGLGATDDVGNYAGVVVVVYSDRTIPETDPTDPNDYDCDGTGDACFRPETFSVPFSSFDASFALPGGQPRGECVARSNGVVKGGSIGWHSVPEVSDSAGTCDLAGLTDGEWTVEVTVTDAAGNSGVFERVFTVDTVRPTVVITGPADSDADGDGWMDDPVRAPDVTIEYAVSDAGSGVDESTGSCGARRRGAVTYGDFTIRSGSPSCTFTGLVDGIYEFELAVSDNVGLEGESIVRGVVEAGPFEEGVQFCTASSCDATVELPGVDPQDITELYCRGLGTASSSGGDCSNGDCSSIGDLDRDGNPDVVCGVDGLAPGSNRFVLVADSTGNDGSRVVYFTVFRDMETPSIETTDPVDDDSDGDDVPANPYRQPAFGVNYLVGDDSFAVTGDGGFASAVCTASSRQTPKTDFGSMVRLTGGAGGNVRCDFDGLEEGGWDVTLEVTDRAGRISRLTRSVIVDATAPTVDPTSLTHYNDDGTSEDIAIDEEGLQYVRSSTFDVFFDVDDLNAGNADRASLSVACTVERLDGGHGGHGGGGGGGCGGLICGANGCGPLVCGTDGCTPVTCGDNGCSPMTCGTEGCAPVTCGTQGCASLQCGPSGCTPMTCGTAGCDSLACGPNGCTPMVCGAGGCTTAVCGTGGCAPAACAPLEVDKDGDGRLDFGCRVTVEGEGRYRIQLSVTDRAGNLGVTAIEDHVDMIGVMVTVTDSRDEDCDGSVDCDRPADFDVPFTAVDTPAGSGVDWSTAECLGSSTSNPGSTPIRYTLSDSSGDGVPDVCRVAGAGEGELDVEIGVSDYAGRRTPFHRRYVVDSTPPTVTFGDGERELSRTPRFEARARMDDDRLAARGIAVYEIACVPRRFEVPKPVVGECEVEVEPPTSPGDSARVGLKVAVPGDGDYELEVEAIDAAGNSTRMFRPFTVDSASPGVRFTRLDGQPIDPTQPLVTGNGTARLEFDTTEPATTTCEVVQIGDDGSPLGTPEPRDCASGWLVGEWWPPSYPDGSTAQWCAYVTATDAAGNRGTAEQCFAYVKTTPLPSVVVTGFEGDPVEPGERLESSGPAPLFQYWVEGLDDPTASCSAWRLGDDGEPDGVEAAVDCASGNGRIGPTDTPGAGGEWRVRVVVTDADGDSAVAEFAFFWYPPVPPRVTIQYPVDEVVQVDPATGRLNVDFLVESDDPPLFARCLVDGATVAYPCARGQEIAVSPGPHELRVIVTDADGDTAADTTHFFAEIDGVPAIGIAGLSDGATLAAFSVPVERTPIDTAYPEILQFSSMRCGLDDATAVDCAEVEDELSTLDDGPHSLRVAADDSNGVEVSRLYHFTIDTAAPTITFTRFDGQPIDPATPLHTANPQPIAEFTISEPAIATCATMPMGVDGTADQSAADYQPCTLRIQPGPNAGTSDADNKNWCFGVRAVDAALNAGSSTLCFTIDTTPPDLQVLSPLPDLPVACTIAQSDPNFCTFPVTMELFDAASPVHVEASVQGRQFTTLSNASMNPRRIETHQLTVDLREMTTGLDVEYRIRATDWAGNSVERRIVVPVVPTGGSDVGPPVA